MSGELPHYANYDGQLPTYDELMGSGYTTESPPSYQATLECHATVPWIQQGVQQQASTQEQQSVVQAQGAHHQQQNSYDPPQQENQQGEQVNNCTLGTDKDNVEDPAHTAPMLSELRAVMPEMVDIVATSGCSD